MLCSRTSGWHSRSISAFGAAIDELQDLVDRIVAHGQKSADKKGPVADKSKALLLLGDLAHEIAGAVHACAVKAGNDSLAQRTNFN